MKRVYKNLFLAKISVSIMAANMWKNILKNVESDNNKMFSKPYLIFLQRNGTYFLNKPRNNISGSRICEVEETLAPLVLTAENYIGFYQQILVERENFLPQNLHEKCSIKKERNCASIRFNYTSCGYLINHWKQSVKF